MTAPADLARPAVHVIVVGSGIAGLTTALHATDHGCRVTLVTKDVLEHANTRYAQGGIAGVMFDDDRLEDHVRDTLVAGAGLADEAAVRVLVEEGPARIRELIALGVAFDRGDDGRFVKGLEAAHSYPRILHAGGDATGTAIEKALVAGLRTSGVTVIEHAFLVDLVVHDGRVLGVDLLIGEEPATDAAAAVPGQRRRVDADAVVLATGGAGQLYAHTTNPPVATGDGIAAAIRAGAEVADLEFFQFHPTVLPAAPSALEGEPGHDAFLVSEAVRGEGATLIDENGRSFIEHPDRELAPRDVVARAIAKTMIVQQGRPVFLDATHLRAAEAERREFLARRFPTIDAAVRDRGLDWAVDPIPVTPAAHYLMGGVLTDLDGRTSLPGLYAVGEVARTGVHGANRLASNSLLEGAVFGARAGDVIAADAEGARWSERSEARRPLEPAARSLSERSETKRPRELGDLDPAQIVVSDVERPIASGREPFSRAALQELLWRDAGLVRSEFGLRRAASALETWREQKAPSVTEWDYEDDNLLLVGAHLVAAALARTGSVGAHFRSDALKFATPQERPMTDHPERPRPESDLVSRGSAREGAA